MSEKVDSLSKILSHIKSSSAYVHDASCVARFSCPNNAEKVDDMESTYSLECLIREYRSLVDDFTALERYLDSHNG